MLLVYFIGHGLVDIFSWYCCEPASNAAQKIIHEDTTCTSEQVLPQSDLPGMYMYITYTGTRVLHVNSTLSSHLKDERRYVAMFLFMHRIRVSG